MTRSSCPASIWSWEQLSGVTLTLSGPGRAAELVAALNSRQQALLKTLAAGDSIALGEYYRQFAADISERQARRDLETLLEIGAVTREGAGSKTRDANLLPLLPDMNRTSACVTVFIAGSIKIKHLDRKFKERIDKIIASGIDLVVGDADGADTAIQTTLFEQGSSNTTVNEAKKRQRAAMVHSGATTWASGQSTASPLKR